MVWLYALAGPQDFIAGGTLAAGSGSAAAAELIFVLLVIGMGVKAALFPLHSWLPKAMVAPAPVSALLHAVAVVKAGAFGWFEWSRTSMARRWSDLGPGLPLVLLAGFTIVYGSVLALLPERHQEAPGLLDRQPGVVHRAGHRRRRAAGHHRRHRAPGAPGADEDHAVLLRRHLRQPAGHQEDRRTRRRRARLPWTSACFTSAPSA
jgi:hypothetical protein